MITLLANCFIKEKEGPGARKAYGTLCSIVGIALNILLFAGKYFAGMISGSVAITADAFNNLSDAGSSFITLVGFLFAGKKPDPGHPFGHGRFEYISGFIVSMAILMMGFELLKTSITKVMHPEAVDTSLLAMGILVVSILVKLYMTWYNKKIGKKIDSKAMEATSMDSLSDSIATLFVLAAMIVMRAAHINIDGICGLVVALFILYAGYNAARETLNPLLGVAPESEFVEEIQQIVMSHDLIRGIHDLVVHDYGPGRVMISLHAEVPGNHNIYEIHDLIDRIEKELNEKLHCEAVIHMDPIETDNKQVETMKEQVTALIKEMNQQITIHDFRMVTGDTHTNLIFDAVIPFEIVLSDQELKEQIQSRVQILGKQYVAVVQIDRPYV